jgi:glycerol-3-phosphate acyltransferase PlsX
VKGLEEVREAGRILREETFPDFAYRGFVEGDDIGQGKVDVVVTEGFAGNIALKAAEGTARQIGQYLRAAMTRSLSAKIGYFFARGAFAQLRERMDPRRANGGVFLGLNGIVIKSHGGADAEGYAAAIEVGHGVVRDELLAKIRAALGRQGRTQAERTQADKTPAAGGQIREGEVLESKVQGQAVGGAAS